jgi:hypothetical protein
MTVSVRETSITLRLREDIRYDSQPERHENNPNNSNNPNNPKVTVISPLAVAVILPLTVTVISAVDCHSHICLIV